MPASLRYLGIDPGLTATGWGVIGVEGSKLSHIANGTISSNAKRSLAERLVEIEAGLVQILETYTPDAAAVEQAFVARDAEIGRASCRERVWVAGGARNLKNKS